MTKSTVVNKFNRAEPPGGIEEHFIELGFKTIHYPDGPSKGEVRKSIKQLYKFCQWFVSGLKEDALQHFRNPQPGLSDPDVVDDQLLNFLRWRGPLLFSDTRNSSGLHKLPVYSEDFSDERLLGDFKPLREIIQYLAFVLNQRKYRSGKRRESEIKTEVSTSDIERPTSGHRPRLTPSKTPGSTAAPSDFEPPAGNEDSDHDSTYTEEDQESEEIEQTEHLGEETLTRKDIRRAILEYQELPPVRHRRKKPDILTLKVGTDRLLQFLEQQDKIEAPANVQQAMAAAPPIDTSFSHSASPDRSPVNRSSLPSPPTSAKRADTAIRRKPVSKTSSQNWVSEFFVAYQHPQTATSDDALKAKAETDWNQVYPADWYEAHLPKGGHHNPRWYDMSWGLGIHNRPFVCDEIRSTIATLYFTYPDIYAQKLGDRKIGERLRAAAKEMDTRLKDFILQRQPNCTEAFRVYCWRTLLKYSRPDMCPPNMPSMPNTNSPYGSWPSQRRDYWMRKAQQPAFTASNKEFTKPHQPWQRPNTVLGQEPSQTASKPKLGRDHREPYSRPIKESDELLNRMREQSHEDLSELARNDGKFSAATLTNHMKVVKDSGRERGSIGGGASYQASPANESFDIGHATDYKVASPIKRPADETGQWEDNAVPGSFEKRRRTDGAEGSQTPSNPLPTPSREDSLQRTCQSRYETPQPLSKQQNADFTNNNGPVKPQESTPNAYGSPGPAPLVKQEQNHAFGANHQTIQSEKTDIPLLVKSKPRIQIRKPAPMRFWFKDLDSEQNAVILEAQLTKEKIQQIWDKIQDKCRPDEVSQLDFVTRTPIDADALEIRHVTIEPNGPYPELKAFLEQRAFHAYRDSGIDIQVEPIMIEGYGAGLD